MSIFDIASALVLLAALFGYLNLRFLKLPSTIGLMIIALVSSLAIILLDQIIPSYHMGDIIRKFIGRIDLNETLMKGMLAFLLFAGALHVNFDDLYERRFTIASLATAGVIISTILTGYATYYILKITGLEISLLYSLVFGALISPTDPVAVIGILKTAKTSKSLEAKITGESLFNDGVGIVIFIILVALASAGPEAGFSFIDVTVLFFREAFGGAMLGLVFGYVAYMALKSIDNYQIEVLITLALVMSTYSAASRLHMSGPIAEVVAGLFVGNRGKRFAMSTTTIDHVEKFWSLLDDILNAVLFLLIGLEVFVIQLRFTYLISGLLLIPTVIAVRFISVSIPISLLQFKKEFSKGVIRILTWSGLRGGISVALVLSLPPFEGRDLLITCTYIVVLFSIIVQGLTLKPFINRIQSGINR
ncbi:MAG TPA: sodium:proton antiporter [Nitrospirae bacterium]|nr:Na(+)/H(+) antiporter NhaP [bacterium BMS3Abin06]HDH11544.1 sodium:proton antiporter [Nitrospirota bacterium]HDL20859.1 sodium:proton antiporter [Nitrospirota bacterium]HDZ00622.1 sodium:proton antiporter [Nitrospirota bacterium]